MRPRGNDPCLVFVLFLWVSTQKSNYPAWTSDYDVETVSLFFLLWRQFCPVYLNIVQSGAHRNIFDCFLWRREHHVPVVPKITDATPCGGDLDQLALFCAKCHSQNSISKLKIKSTEHRPLVTKSSISGWYFDLFWIPRKFVGISSKTVLVSVAVTLPMDIIYAQGPQRVKKNSHPKTQDSLQLLFRRQTGSIETILGPQCTWSSRNSSNGEKIESYRLIFRLRPLLSSPRMSKYKV